jgi:hypothetical protein
MAMPMLARTRLEAGFDGNLIDRLLSAVTTPICSPTATAISWATLGFCSAAG